MVIKKIIKTFIFISLSYLLFSTDKINININSDKKNVEVNEVFQIDVKIEGISSDISLDEIKNINENMIIRYVGEMHGYGYSTVDNKRSDYYVLTFIVKITKPGDYEIGPFVINVKDKKLSSDLLKINVSETNSQTVSDQNNKENYNSEKNDKENDFYLLELSVNKKEVFINEPIDFEVNFYRRLDFRNPNYKFLTFPKTAWVERIEVKEKPNNKIQKNNQNYLVVNVEKEKVFISKPGTYSIEPATLDFIGLISPNFFSVPEHIILKTEPITITVKALPEPAPSGFTGAIGSFNLKAELDPMKLETKKSTTLKISLEGDGNFQNINEIDYKIDNSFETYSSNSIIEKSGINSKTKIWETLLVPSTPGKFDIKLNDFHYFDIKQKKYMTLKGKKITVNVLECKDEQSSKKNLTSIDFSQINKTNNEINNLDLFNINYIKISLGKNNTVYKYKLWFKFVIGLYIIIFIVIIFFILNKYIIFNYINKNTNSEKKAYKSFITHINKIKQNINKVLPQKEIDHISNIMEKYFISKFHIDSIEFTSKSLNAKLSNYLSAKMLNHLKDIISKLNFIRFGSEKISNNDFLILINTIKKFIIEIELSKK